MPVLVSDTNIWIDLERGGLLEEVFSLPHEFVTTDFVWYELYHPSGEGLEALGLTIEPLSALEVAGLEQLKVELKNSSLADVSCFYLAEARQWTLLTNDGAVRKAGLHRQLEVHGILWLMDELYRHQAVDGNRLALALDSMLDAGARLPHEECDHRKAQWRNQ